MSGPSRFFSFIHSSKLIYNTCWEDPRLDREALQFSSTDRVAMITSAGCNALDYLLAGAGEVHAVDMNYRQNALLELKVAAIRAFDYPTFFQMFGRGRLAHAHVRYHTALRPHLSQASQHFWDRAIHYFTGTGWRNSFYFHGASGFFARLFLSYLSRRGLLELVRSILESPDIRRQRAVFEQEIHPYLWNQSLQWIMSRDTTMALLGVPASQRKLIERDSPRGMQGFLDQCMQGVFRDLPLKDNYFWRLYINGSYSHECCPEYLTERGYSMLRDGLLERLTIHTGTMTELLRRSPLPFTKIVLLDHQDWLISNDHAALADEWQAIADATSPGARIIWRSASPHVRFVDTLKVRRGGKPIFVGKLLDYQEELAARLHREDRVHTYGGFAIATVNT